ncbi:MAG: cytochrome c3 family protein [Deltaproteobacteria bacterium]|nr:cytochrome c3 family protein [Deltaproteobacteria bacterium]
MKKAILLALLAMVFSLFAAATAMATIENSRHNLSDWGAYTYSAEAGGTTEVCIFCHTPHNAVKNYPLWNRTNPVTVTFNFYSSAHFNMSPGGSRSGIEFTPGSVSLLCMSCHDGATGLFSAVVNKFGEVATFAGGPALKGPAAIGADPQSLSNDHPVNFQYTQGSDATYFRPQSGAGSAEEQGIKFFGSTGNYVECASCHDPHRIDTGKFLRQANTSSNLCQSCHQK